jgi:hypothetical protein
MYLNNKKAVKMSRIFRIMFFEYRELMRIFEPKRGEATGD